MSQSTFVRSLDEVFASSAGKHTAVITGGSFTLSDGQVVEMADHMLALSELIRRAVVEERVAHVEVDEVLVSPERAAELLGVTRPTVYAWQDRGRLGRVDQANQRSVPLADVEMLREAREAKRVRAKELVQTGALSGDDSQSASLFEREAAQLGSWAAVLITDAPVEIASPRRRPERPAH